MKAHAQGMVTRGGVPVVPPTLKCDYCENRGGKAGRAFLYRCRSCKRAVCPHLCDSPVGDIATCAPCQRDVSR